MTLKLAKTAHKDMRENLRNIKRIIRTRLPAEANSRENKSLLAAISGLKKQLPEDHSNETDRLRLAVVEAELYSHHGEYVKASRVLEADWKTLKPLLAAHGKNNPLEPTNNRELLRQKIWVLMHYVFCRHYHVDGQHTEALRLLKRVHDVIHSELETRDYHPAGTLAMWNYYMGLCHRVKREFHSAEQHFLSAQKETHERVRRELKKPKLERSTRNYELAYKDAMTVRIQCGLAWVAFQLGQFYRAEQNLLTARSFLIGNIQPIFKHFVDSMLWMVARRRARFEDSAYVDILAAIESQYEAATNAQEQTRLRCGFELARGYLDLAEFHDQDEIRKAHHLGVAAAWIEKMRLSPEPKVQQRYLLHRVRYFIIRGDYTAAETELEKTKAISKSTRIEQRAIRVLEAVLAIKRQYHAYAIELLVPLLEDIKTVGGAEGKQVLDPVLEAECYVLLAQAYVGHKDFEPARRYLAQWRLVAQFVDNHYLKHLARSIVPIGMPREIPYEFPIKLRRKDDIPSILDVTDKIGRWMIDCVRERRPEFKTEQLAIAFGLSRPQFARRFGSAKKRT